MSARKLMIVESPNKIKKLKSILGSEWDVSASVGHICDLPAKEVGISIPDFVPQYVISADKKKVVSNLKALAKGASEVWLATDADREGEAIAYHLKRELNLKTYQRCTFQEITEKAVKGALENPRQLDMDMVMSQETRRMADRLIGYTVSEVIKPSVGEWLPMGRVQSPAVRLILDRERAIENFKPTKHFGVRLSFATGRADSAWFAELNTKPLIKDQDGYFLDAGLAEKISTIKNVTVLFADSKDAKRAPSAPFKSSTLQTFAFNALGWATDKTMKIAQKLFEQGLITYHRTDSINLSNEAFDAIRADALTRQLPVLSKKRTWKDGADAQGAHEAIRPSYLENDEAGTDADEKALYRLIWQRTVASQLEDAVYTVVSAKLQGELDGKQYEFQATGRTLKYAGFLVLLDDDQDDDKDDNEAKNPVPVLEVGASLSVAKGEVLNKTTKAPSRFTEGTIVAELERLGIGRPSTYSSIISKIKTGKYGHGYVEEKAFSKGAKAKKFLVPVEREKADMPSKTERLIDALVGKFNFIDLGYTRDLETDLDLIADGKTTHNAVLSAFWDKLEADKLAYRSTATVLITNACPDCGMNMTRRPSKADKTKFWWSCTGYPTCKITALDKDGKPNFTPKAEKVVYVQTGVNPCPLCGLDMFRRPSKTEGKFWYGCTGYPACKQTAFEKDGKPDYQKTSEV
jgi:DNA topoisomerase-1